MSLLSRSLLALLVLCATAAFAKGTDTPGWIKATWTHADQRLPSDDLVRQFPVHGIFSNVAFVVGVSDIIPRLEALGFSAEYFRVFDPTEDLYVAQFNRVANLALADFGASKELQQRLVLSLFESGLAVVDSDSFLENNDRFSWASKVEIASLSKKAFVPVEPLNKHPLYERLMNVTYDPRIARVLDAISVDTLYTLLFDLTEGFFTRQSASSEIREAQSYLEDAFNGLGLNVSVHSYRDDYAANICADFLGSTNPEQLVITGAHYDSRSIDTNNPTLRAPGAVDNGSGTVGMIEMARVLVESQIRLANTVRICVWTGEEQGLLGSKAYAQKLNQEGANILAYFNADMTGYQLPNTPITLGMKDKSITQWLLDLSYVITGLYVPQMPVALSASCCSDYISFFELGYPSIGYFQNAGSASDYPDYHKSTDSLDKVNFQQVRLQTQAVLAAVLTFAEPL